MATNSSVVGYLGPLDPQPTYDDALDDLLHDVFVGLTGLTGDLVRPRLTPEPGQQPDFSVNWLAFGVVRSDRDVNAAIVNDPTIPSATVDRTEILEVLLSAYGPGAHGVIERISDGLQLSQNRETLDSLNIGLIQCRDPRILPALLKERWVRRVDMTIMLRRKTLRSYPVLTVLSAGIGLNNELYTTQIETP